MSFYGGDLHLLVESAQENKRVLEEKDKIIAQLQQRLDKSTP